MMSPDLQRLPIVNSEYLFRSLAELYAAVLVCDVGSYDGAHALGFTRSGRRVMALEANPENAAALAGNQNITSAGIKVFHLAAWNKDAEVAFNVIVPRSGVEHDWVRKVSSIRIRSDRSFDSRVVPVRAVRLDSLLMIEAQPLPSSIALWIDVEGVGYEVLEGIAGIRSVVSVVHVEVETRTFWEGQHLWEDILMLMRDFGFCAVARSDGDLQCNVVFTNARLQGVTRARLNWTIFLAWARRRAGLLRRWIRRAL